MTLSYYDLFTAHEDQFRPCRPGGEVTTLDVDPSIWTGFPIRLRQVVLAVVDHIVGVHWPYVYPFVLQSHTPGRM